ncbi:hypothetical protein [Spirillospora sp. CA-294931]|uniref:hypothetical protein n=1 Tax=Spirillospora sp. CA-294931 TaxID=3240042 RepID=UPI003D93745C
MTLETRSRWTGAIATAVLLCASGPLGILAMGHLQDAADGKTRAACETAPSTAQWTKGYDFTMPLAILIAVLLGMTLAIAVLAKGKTAAPWTKPLAACLILAALLALIPLSVTVMDYHAYPGADISTNNGPPCGVR